MQRTTQSKGCPFIKEKCYQCGKVGHIRKACRQNANKHSPATSLHVMQGNENAERHYWTGLYRVFKGNDRKPISVTMEVKNREFVMERLLNIKPRIQLKVEPKPRFWKAIPVAFARIPAVERRLDQLEAEGIVKRMIHSEWAAPIVTPIKKDGEVRICGDFKLTINPQLDVDEYPLPRMEEIYANLSGGQQFRVIDLRQTYLQIEGDEESKTYLTVNTHRRLYQY